LHYLLPAILSCLLEQRVSRDHWSLRDLSAKCCGQIIRLELTFLKTITHLSVDRKYTTAANRLQQRTIDIFYRILSKNKDEYTWPTQYGAFIGLCEMSHKVNFLFK